MSNSNNIEVTVSKMLDTLHASTDYYFRNHLVSKITALAENKAPDHQWYLNKMLLLF